MADRIQFMAIGLLVSIFVAPEVKVACRGNPLYKKNGGGRSGKVQILVWKLGLAAK